MMPRFVLLEHEMPCGSSRPTHWDLMLEDGMALATWELDHPLEACYEATVQRLADHRLVYLEYEGPVSGGRGTVRCLDRGTFVTRERSADRWVVQLQGTQWRGVLELTLLDPVSQGWRARFAADEEAIR